MINSVATGIYGWHLRRKHRGKISANNSSRKVFGIHFLCDRAAPNRALLQQVIPPRVCETQRHQTRYHVTFGEYSSTVQFATAPIE